MHIYEILHMIQLVFRIILYEKKCFIKEIKQR